MIEPKESDRVFYDSPDAGHPTCMCSRCGNQIREDEMPIRMWPTEPGDIGFDPKASGGTEFRYCPKCCEAEGMKIGEPVAVYEEEFYPDPPAYLECRKCGRTTGIEGERYIGISEDGFCTICVARMQDDGLSNEELLNQDE